jgi:hypothetical protein
LKLNVKRRKKKLNKKESRRNLKELKKKEFDLSKRRKQS